MHKFLFPDGKSLLVEKKKEIKLNSKKNNMFNSFFYEISKRKNKNSIICGKKNLLSLISNKDFYTQ